MNRDNGPIGVLDRLRALAEEDPQAPALAAPGRPKLTRGKLLPHITQFVEQLRDMGIRRSNRVAIILPPGPEMAVVNLAAVIHAVAVPFNPEARRKELADGFKQIHPDILVVARDSASVPREVAKSLNIPTCEIAWKESDPAGTFECTTVSKVVGGRDAPEASSLTPLDEAALILQTSGTTSRPKLVPLSHRNLLSAADNLIRSLALNETDRCLNLMPQFHIGGIWDTIAGPLLSGGSVHCGGTFSRASFLAGLQDFQPTWLQAVPAMIREIIDMRISGQESPPGSLRLLRSVSAPLPASLREEWERCWGVPVIEIYGMTETAGVITSNPLPPDSRPRGSVGLSAGPRVRIVDPSGTSVPAGTVGEVVVQSDSLTSGYLDAPEATAAAFHADGFHTGDLGYLDPAGYLHLSGRIKDLINRGGEKISPAEINEALLAHDCVLDAACFSVEDPTLGEEVEAAVVLVPQAPVEAISEILESLRLNLAYHKVPRRLVHLEAIPRTRGGKLQKKLLAEACSATASPQVSSLPRESYTAPDSVASKWVAELWADVLGLDRVGLHDDFFACGGNSLKAAFFVNRIQENFAGQILFVSSVYDAPTPSLYESFLRKHHPELISLVLGDLVKSEAGPESRLNPEMKEVFLSSLGLSDPGHKPEAESPNPAAVFILSPPRSGSTLLRAMMAGHSRLFAPPELYLLSYETLAERRRWFGEAHSSQLEGVIRAMMQALDEPSEKCLRRFQELEQKGTSTLEFYRILQSWIGDRILVDKTPAYSTDLEVLRKASTSFDRPFFIHLARHPYGMIRSFEEAKLAQLWWPRLIGPDAPPERRKCPFGSRQLAEMIWSLIHQNAHSFLADIEQSRKLVLRFEDLVARPREEMNRICKFLNLAFDSNMLRPHDNTRERMTDGVHPASRMIGDPKFHSHRAIDAAAADLWKMYYDHDFLAEDTWRLARSMGYSESVESACDRIAFDV